MAKVPYEVTKESYLLKSTFFYNKLKANGYFELFMDVQKLSSIEGATLNWNQRDKWKISASAWDVLTKSNIAPCLCLHTLKFCNLIPLS